MSSSSGKPDAVWVRKTERLIIHPDLDAGPLVELSGIRGKDSPAILKRSNMRRFPNQTFLGATNPVPYGRSIVADDLYALERMLTALSSIKSS